MRGDELARLVSPLAAGDDLGRERLMRYGARPVLDRLRRFHAPAWPRLELSMIQRCGNWRRRRGSGLQRCGNRQRRGGSRLVRTERDYRAVHRSALRAAHQTSDKSADQRGGGIESKRSPSEGPRKAAARAPALICCFGHQTARQRCYDEPEDPAIEEALREPTPWARHAERTNLAESHGC